MGGGDVSCRTRRFTRFSLAAVVATGRGFGLLALLRGRSFCGTLKITSGENLTFFFCLAGFSVTFFFVSFLPATFFPVCFCGTLVFLDPFFMLLFVFYFPEWQSPTLCTQWRCCLVL
jgi:hypothetical protein